MFKNLALSVKYLSLLGLVFLTLVAGLMVALQWPVGSHGLTWLVSLNKVFAEMLLVLALALLLFAVWWPSRFLSWLLVVAYCLVLTTQIASLQFSSAYLPSIALENAQHADFLLDTNKVGWFLIVFLALLNGALQISKRVRPTPRLGARVLLATMLIIVSALIKNDSHWLPQKLVDQRFDFYNSGRAGIEHKAPGSAMIDTLKQYYQSQARLGLIDQASVELPREAVKFAFEYGIKLNEHSEDYPLLKTVQFTSPPQFIDQKNWQQKNVIVFFVEGLSSRVIQPYSQQFPGISPNFEEFAKQALVVDDYFNHSFATYRALSGQLCSIYANNVLSADTNYFCLPHVLSENGYDTHFFVSQSLAETNLDEMAQRAGFDEVLGSKELIPYIPNTPELDYGLDEIILFDKNFVESFKRWLQQRDSQKGDSELSRPFFATLYNFQTHTGVRLNSNIKYVDPTKKSSSYVLDTFFNFDQAFGNFWNYFKTSPYYDNTIVIVTSDHATFGSKDFAALVSDMPGYSRIFADKIPLMIYHPDSPSGRFSARNASSINFAPTLMHTLNVNATKASFVGNSIFEEGNTYPNPLVVSSGISYYKTDEGGWLRQRQDEPTAVPANSTQAKSFHDLVLFTQDLERQNRLAPIGSSE